MYNPPRDTYADVVFDNPRVFFTFDDIPVAGSAEVPNLGTHFELREDGRC